MMYCFFSSSSKSADKLEMIECKTSNFPQKVHTRKVSWNNIYFPLIYSISCLSDWQLSPPITFFIVFIYDLRKVNRIHTVYWSRNRTENAITNASRERAHLSWILSAVTNPLTHSSVPVTITEAVFQMTTLHYGLATPKFINTQMARPRCPTTHDHHQHHHVLS